MEVNKETTDEALFEDYKDSDNHIQDSIDENQTLNADSEVLSNNNESLDDGIEFLDAESEENVIELISEEPDKNQSKARSHKTKNRYDYIRLTVLVIAVCVFVFSAYKLISIFVNYQKGNKEYSKVEKEVFSNENDEQPTILVNSDIYEEIIENNKSDGYEFMPYDHNALLAINNEAQCYLDMPAISTRVPVVQGADNDYYLTHSVEKNYHSYGCPFIDYRIKDGINGKNPIIYGHAMKNGAMFGMLNRYLGSDFYHEGNNRYFYMYCEKGIYIYEIFSVYITDCYDKQSYVFSYSDTESYANYIDTIKNKTRYYTGVNVTAEDEIITLSTCYDLNDLRILVHAKRLK